VAQPAVSIIVATYNRSNVLRCALETVVGQTFADWEAWVIGDACTDDTEQVVRSFGDPRIQFHNLESNFGEQSGPNNEGVRRARGACIAYLNHDDLWLPQHLERLHHHLMDAAADLVFSLVEEVHKPDHVLIGCDSPSLRYEPTLSVPASCWLLRRELIEEIGPWRSCRECYVAPSQDWLFRAWKRKKTMILLPQVTVVAIKSIAVPLAYRRRDAELQHLYLRRIRESAYADRALQRRAARQDQAAARGWLARSKRVLLSIIHRISIAVGVHPQTALIWYFYRRDGGLIHHLRRVRGLPPLKR
jgi:glycosyltransferase involved in cell wall biosynthesis